MFLQYYHISTMLSYQPYAPIKGLLKHLFITMGGKVSKPSAYSSGAHLCQFEIITSDE